MRKSITRALLGGLGATVITVFMAVSSWSMTNQKDPAAAALTAVSGAPYDSARAAPVSTGE